MKKTMRCAVVGLLFGSLSLTAADGFAGGADAGDVFGRIGKYVSISGLFEGDLVFSGDYAGRDSSEIILEVRNGDAISLTQQGF